MRLNVAKHTPYYMSHGQSVFFGNDEGKFELLLQVIQYNNSETSEPLNVEGHQLLLFPSDNFLIFSNAQTLPMGSPGSL